MDFTEKHIVINYLISLSADCITHAKFIVTTFLNPCLDIPVLCYQVVIFFCVISLHLMMCRRRTVRIITVTEF